MIQDWHPKPEKTHRDIGSSGALPHNGWPWWLNLFILLICAIRATMMITLVQAHIAIAQRTAIR